jgi:hypothetical protein
MNYSVGMCYQFLVAPAINCVQQHSRLQQHPEVQHSLPALEAMVEKGEITAGLAADKLLHTFLATANKE